MKPNYFLKVDKGLFATGLNPLEILLVSQIAEFETNTGDCFISDKVLADNFGVSESTISRTLKALEAKGIVMRTTKNVRGGKERHIAINKNKLEELTTSKMRVDESAQPAKCSLSTSKLTVDNKQNDLIKDNINNIKEIDNNSGVIHPTDEITPLQSSQEVEEIEGKQAVIMTSQEALEKYGLSACANRVATGIANCYWISGDLIKVI